MGTIGQLALNGFIVILVYGSVAVMIYEIFLIIRDFRKNNSSNDHAREPRKTKQVNYFEETIAKPLKKRFTRRK